MIGKNLAQEECNWLSKFQGMDFNIIKILSAPFNKVCPLALFSFRRPWVRALPVCYADASTYKMVDRNFAEWDIRLEHLICDVIEI